MPEVEEAPRGLRAGLPHRTLRSAGALLVQHGQSWLQKLCTVQELASVAAGAALVLALRLYHGGDELNPPSAKGSNPRLLAMQLILNEMQRNTAPSRRAPLVAACWGLPARKSILVKVKQPNLEECPTWQVVRYLNQAGAIMPSHMLAVYVTRGEVGQAMLREDAATFSRTWECKRVLQCIDYVDGPEPRMLAVLGMRWVEPTVQQVRETLRRQEDRLRVTLFGTSAPYGEVDVGYADDLLPQEREMVVSGELDRKLDEIMKSRHRLLENVQRRKMRSADRQLDGRDPQILRH